ncbi:MAG: endonuclease/exonuclease/phosphatase family protein [Bacteroides sp.]|jgi:endonuclease/exonuclease/phosphatase family metal-dependent hydrolase|nr:endonuclease/exonuclease/phosphatase family protein [Bacteroides sp.]MCI1682795.1 endonuclease/exonuclease/phosphatase family protein [Bacteroides sp.]
MGKADVKGLFYSILIVITLILSGITIVASYAGHYSPTESVIMPLLGVSMPVLLIVDLLVSISWAIARKRWALVPLFAFFFNWSYLTAIIQFNFKKGNKNSSIVSQNPQSNLLTLATYNIHSFGNEITGYSCKEVARYMKEKGVDILCFQEFEDNQYFTIDSIRHAFSNWQHAVISTKDSIQGILPIALFSRYPIIKQQFITYPKSSNCSMFCDVIINKDTIRIINNHLQTTNVSQNRKKWERDLSSSNSRQELSTIEEATRILHGNFVKRAGQVDSICRIIDASPYPVIVCGDFNSLPSSYTYHQLAKRLKDGFKTCGRGYMYTYRYYKHLLRIDYIFHSTAFEGLNYYSPKQEFCSDHNPVIMKMRTTP